jgi:hypothetical protein
MNVPNATRNLVLLLIIWAGNPALGQGLIDVVKASTADGDLEEFARVIRSVGDLNNDGLEDIALTALRVESGGARRGVVIAYSLSGLAAKQIWRIDLPSVASTDRIASLAALGDIDGDGVPDIGVAARGTIDLITSHTARFFVVSGATGGLLSTISGSGPSTSTSFPGDYIDIEGGVDANLDGRLDIALWEPAAGTAFHGVLRMQSWQSGSMVWDIGGTAASRLGQDVIVTEDSNLDGIADLAIHRTENESRIYSISGATGSPLAVTATIIDANRLGYGMALLGDLNGDGIGDLLSTWKNDILPKGTDVVGVVSGADLAPIKVLSDMQFFAVGGGWIDRNRLSAIDDTDGDGNRDIVLANPEFIAGSQSNGAARVYSGSTFKHLFTATIGASGTATWSFGRNVSGAADLNGDGRGDILVGSPEPSHTGSSSHGGYVYSGHCGSVQLGGPGCPGSGGSTPVLTIWGCPASACSVTMSLGGYSGGYPVLYVAGTGPASYSLPGGCALLVASPHVTYASLTPPSPPGQGQLSFPISIPNLPFIGLQAEIQVIFLDPLTPKGYSASNSVRIGF